MLVVKKLRCENKENPIGIELGMVSISWELDSDRRNVLQAEECWVAAPQEQTQVMSFEKDIAVHTPIRQARLYN